MAKKKSSILINTLVLFVVTFVAILALAIVNQVTTEPIEQAEINARAEVYETVYADAENFSEVENSETLIENSAQMLTDAGYDGCSINDVLAVTDTAGNIEGYVIAATSPNGYGGDIQIAIGIKDGTLTGFDVITLNETAGLGSKAAESEFKDQFAGKSAETLEYTKTGASADNEIDAISGATITTNAVTEAVNAAITFYQDSFGGGLQAEEELDTMEKAYPDVDLDALTPVDVVDGESDDVTVDDVQMTADGGYIITATAHNGYDGDLQIALGIGSDSVIKGFATVVCNETPALGGQCESDEFAEQFVGMKADTVTYVSADAVLENNEIDAITSATITTNAVVTAVNGAVDYYNSQLKGE